MPFIDVRPMEFITPGSELIPLNTRMSNIEDIVEYLVRGKFRFWTFYAFDKCGKIYWLKSLRETCFGIPLYFGCFCPLSVIITPLNNMNKYKKHERISEV